MVLEHFVGRWRLLLLLLAALLVALGPAIEIAGHGYAPGTVSAKGGNGKGHGDKGKGHKKKGNRKHGETKGNGKKKGHHKIEQATLTAVPLTQNVVTPTPTPPPSEPLATTGTLLVIAYDCQADISSELVDWLATCTTVSPGVTFRLVMNGAPADSATTGTTDDQGNLIFSDLDPGKYHLTEETGDWCYAESDGVDENGDVVVRANQRVTVWIFHCPPALAS
jgi:Prealbumin-like fold domain